MRGSIQQSTNNMLGSKFGRPPPRKAVYGAPPPSTATGLGGSRDRSSDPMGAVTVARVAAKRSLSANNLHDFADFTRSSSAGQRLPSNTSGRMGRASPALVDRSRSNSSRAPGSPSNSDRKPRTPASPATSMDRRPRAMGSYGGTDRQSSRSTSRVSATGVASESERSPLPGRKGIGDTPDSARFQRTPQNSPGPPKAGRATLTGGRAGSARAPVSSPDAQGAKNPGIAAAARSSLQSTQGARSLSLQSRWSPWEGDRLSSNQTTGAAGSDHTPRTPGSSRHVTQSTWAYQVPVPIGGRPANSTGSSAGRANGEVTDSPKTKGSRSFQSAGGARGPTPPASPKQPVGTTSLDTPGNAPVGGAGHTTGDRTPPELSWPLLSTQATGNPETPSESIPARDVLQDDNQVTGSPDFLRTVPAASLRLSLGDLKKDLDGKDKAIDTACEPTAFSSTNEMFLQSSSLGSTTQDHPSETASTISAGSRRLSGGELEQIVDGQERLLNKLVAARDSLQDGNQEPHAIGQEQYTITDVEEANTNKPQDSTVTAFKSGSPISTHTAGMGATQNTGKNTAVGAGRAGTNQNRIYARVAGSQEHPRTAAAGSRSFSTGERGKSVDGKERHDATGFAKANGSQTLSNARSPGSGRMAGNRSRPDLSAPISWTQVSGSRELGRSSAANGYPKDGKLDHDAVGQERKDVTDVAEPRRNRTLNISNSSRKLSKSPDSKSPDSARNVTVGTGRVSSNHIRSYAQGAGRQPLQGATGSRSSSLSATDKGTGRERHDVAQGTKANGYSTLNVVRGVRKPSPPSSPGQLTKTSPSESTTSATVIGTGRVGSGRSRHEMPSRFDVASRERLGRLLSAMDGLKELVQSQSAGAEEDTETTCTAKTSTYRAALTATHTARRSSPSSSPPASSSPRARTTSPEGACPTGRTPPQSPPSMKATRATGGARASSSRSNPPLSPRTLSPRSAVSAKANVAENVRQGDLNVTTARPERQDASRGQPAKKRFDLAMYFSSGYLEGEAYSGSHYELLSGRGSPVLYHKPTGITVWAYGLDVRRQKIEKGITIFHYVSEETFGQITDRHITAFQRWATRAETFSNFGLGLYGTCKEPAQWASVDEILLNNHWPTQQWLPEGTDIKPMLQQHLCSPVHVSINEKFAGCAHFCIPIICDAEQAYDINKRVTPEMEAANVGPGYNIFGEKEPSWRDIWVVRLGNDHDSALANAKLVQASEEIAKVMRRQIGWTKVHSSEDHLTYVNMLARLLEARGRFDEAVPLFWEEYEGFREKLGATHEATLTRLNDLAKLLEARGRFDEAEPLFRKELDGFREKLGAKHPDFLARLSNLAHLLHVRGRLDEAESMYREALEGRRDVLGGKHPDTLQSINNLVLLLNAQGRLEEAEELYRETLSGWEVAWGGSPKLESRT